MQFACARGSRLLTKAHANRSAPFTRRSPAWPHRLAPLLELQRTLLSEEEKVYSEARAAADAAAAAGASSSGVAGTAAAATYQCHVCALLSHRRVQQPRGAPCLAALRLHGAGTCFALLTCRMRAFPKTNSLAPLLCTLSGRLAQSRLQARNSMHPRWTRMRLIVGVRRTSAELRAVRGAQMEQLTDPSSEGGETV
jgi:hypothetical protein